jgi:hypothetical protein
VRTYEGDVAEVYADFDAVRRRALDPVLHGRLAFRMVSVSPLA